MADHVFGDEVMDLARQHTPKPGHATLLVDSKIDTIFDMDDATKVQVENGKVAKIGKQLTDFNAVDTGIFICTDGLMAALEAFKQQKGDASLSDGVQHLATSGRMDTLDIGNGFWQDVDTPEMLAHATELLAQREAATP
jgi:choline kinase